MRASSVSTTVQRGCRLTGRGASQEGFPSPALATEGPSRNPTPLQPRRAALAPSSPRSWSQQRQRPAGEPPSAPRPLAKAKARGRGIPGGQALPVSAFHPQGRLPGCRAAAARNLRGHSFPRGRLPGQREAQALPSGARRPTRSPATRHPAPPGGSSVVPSVTAGHRPGPAPAERSLLCTGRRWRRGRVEGRTRTGPRPRRATIRHHSRPAAVPSDLSAATGRAGPLAETVGPSVNW